MCISCYKTNDSIKTLPISSILKEWLYRYYILLLTLFDYISYTWFLKIPTVNNYFGKLFDPWGRPETPEPNNLLCLTSVSLDIFVSVSLTSSFLTSPHSNHLCELNYFYYSFKTSASNPMLCLSKLGVIDHQLR